MECHAPSEFLSPQQASKIGAMAEDMIAERYLLRRGKTAFFPQNFEDFRDPEAGIGRRELYNAFINFHNAAFARQGGIERLLQLGKVRLVNVPDLATHSPPMSQAPSALREFYEIKPNSTDGRYAGLSKLIALDLLHDACNLDYKRGLTWVVDEHITLSKFDGVSPFLKVSLHYKLSSPGLIVYEICVEDPLEEFSKELKEFLIKLILAIILALLIVISRGRIRFPVPSSVPSA
jgi:hypothetical protein